MGETFRVASLNMDHNLTTLTARSKILAQEVNNLNADIVLLQEVPNSVGLEEMFPGWTVGVREHGTDVGDGQFVGQAVLCKQKPDSTHLWMLPDDGDVFCYRNFAAAVKLRIGGHTIIAVSTHLSWGGHNELLRMQQVETITDQVDMLVDSLVDSGENTPTVVLGGDFNAEPGSDVHRYLSGQTATPRRQYWVDAWTVCGAQPTVEPTVNLNAGAAATTVQVSAALCPGRCIDFLYLRGWVWGRAGQVLAAGRWADTPVGGVWASDHYGVWADVNLEGSPIPPQHRLGAAQ